MATSGQRAWPDLSVDTSHSGPSGVYIRKRQRFGRHHAHQTSVCCLSAVFAIVMCVIVLRGGCEGCGQGGRMTTRWIAPPRRCPWYTSLARLLAVCCGGCFAACACFVACCCGSAQAGGDGGEECERSRPAYCCSPLFCPSPSVSARCVLWRLLCCLQWWSSISRYVVHLVTYRILTRNEKFGMNHALKNVEPSGRLFRCKRPRSRRQHVRSLGGRASRARRAPTRRTTLPAAALCR